MNPRNEAIKLMLAPPPEDKETASDVDALVDEYIMLAMLYERETNLGRSLTADELLDVMSAPPTEVADA